eukprot:7946315-Lingulodinium_polyedra.AAC.1
MAWYGTRGIVRHSTSFYGNIRQYTPFYIMLWHSMAWHGMARRGMVLHGKALYGNLWHSTA